MSGFLVRRLAQFIPVLVIGALAIWGFVYALPGSPAAIIAGAGASQQQIDAINARLGLNHPVWQQFATWLGHSVQGNLGTSAIYGTPVSSLLGTAAPATAQLAIFAMVLLVVLTVPLGIAAGVRPRSIAGRIVKGFLSVSLAVPPFWLGLLLILAFSVKLRVFPPSGGYVPFFDNPGQALRGGFLPALALAVYSASVTARFLAASLGEAMRCDYIRTARAKGAGEIRLVLRHALRNAMLPTMTVAALQVGALLGGAIIIEVIFTYPGLGSLLYTALNSRDYAVIQGALLLIVAIFLAINLIVDLLYAVVDPRIRVS
jgi:peptide/nickel transport system permease protein